MRGAVDREDCPVGTAITVLAGKWKLQVLRMLLLRGPMRFNALQRAVGGIAAKELSRNLGELQYAGLVRVAAAPDGVEHYELTELGSSMEPTFRTLGEFGTAYLTQRRHQAKSIGLGA